MSSARNKVIAGDYNGYQVFLHYNCVYISSGLTDGDVIIANKTTIENYELLTSEHFKSAASGIARGLIGGTLLGPVGLLAGSISAKSKGIYQVVIQFKDGKRSLLEINDKIHKALIASCF